MHYLRHAVCRFKEQRETHRQLKDWNKIVTFNVE